jgi:selenocysteine-specific elongation factor
MYCICTAGHVNHGKTSLVKLLTGFDTDRLKEEKKRGLSIELGFAKYSLNNKLYASIIDTPGHENFIRNMISGAHAVDLVLMVVAANEGVKPQTIEHLNILKLLSINEIVLVITKTDLVNQKELLNLKNKLIGFFSENDFNNIDIIEVSNKNKIGIKNLEKAIFKKFNLVKKDSSQPARLSIDRVFSLEGKGTIVTGTLLGDKITKNSKLEIIPNYKEIRIKGLESFNKERLEVTPGSRTSINIQNLDTNDVKRGEIIAEKNHIVESDFIYVNLKQIKNIKNSSEISFYTGTTKSVGTITKIKKSKIVKIKLRNKIPFLIGDKFIIRNNNGTVGGGEIVLYERLKNESLLKNFILNDINKISILLNEHKTLSLGKLQKYLGKNISGINKFLKNKKEFYLFENDSYIIRTDDLKLDSKILYKNVLMYHKNFPLRKGIPLSNINDKIEKNILIKTLQNNKLIKINEGFIQNYSFKSKPNKDQLVIIKEYFKRLDSNGFMPPTDKSLDIEIMNYLISENLIIKCSNNVFYLKKSYEQLKEKVLSLNNKFNQINIEILRDNLGLSRKYCLAILDKLEDNKIIRRNRV